MSARRRTIRRSSLLPVPPERAWRHATSMREINRETSPWMRMTYPPEADSLGADDARVRVGEPLFASWILLGGVLPVDRFQLILSELEPGHRFVEMSRTSTLRYWRHERTIAPAPGGCTVTDEITFEAPLALAAPLLQRALERFFAHRHRRLAKILR